MYFTFLKILFVFLHVIAFFCKSNCPRFQWESDCIHEMRDQIMFCMKLKCLGYTLPTVNELCGNIRVLNLDCEIIWRENIFLRKYQEWKPRRAPALAALCSHHTQLYCFLCRCSVARVFHGCSRLMLLVPWWPLTLTRLAGRFFKQV